MQAIELNAVITQDHEIHLKLPDDVTANHAKVIVIYENSLKDTTKRSAKWDTFFAAKSVFDDDFLTERDNEIPQEREFYYSARVLKWLYYSFLLYHQYLLVRN